MNAKRPVTVVTKNTDFPSPHAALHNIQCVSLRVFLVVAVSWPESTFVVSSRTLWKLRVALVSRRILCLVNLLIFYTDCFGKWICFLPQIKSGKLLNSIIYFSLFQTQYKSYCSTSHTSVLSLTIPSVISALHSVLYCHQNSSSVGAVLIKLKDKSHWLEYSNQGENVRDIWHMRFGRKSKTWKTYI